MAATDEQILQMAAEIDTLRILGEQFGIKSDFIDGMRAGFIACYFGCFPPEIVGFMDDCKNSIGGVKENIFRHAIDVRYDTLKESFASRRSEILDG